MPLIVLVAVLLVDHAPGIWLPGAMTSMQLPRFENDASASLLPPLAYATLMSDLWMTHLHQRLHSRNAILMADTPPDVAEEVLQALPGYGNNTVRFFLPDERNDAIRWLVTDD